MRLILPLLAPLLIASTAAPPPSVPHPSDKFAKQATQAGKNCRDRIEQVRHERGLPRLKRDKAASDDPLLIAAVDRLIDGCEVLVMRNDTSDIRPLPAFQSGGARPWPAR